MKKVGLHFRLIAAIYSCVCLTDIVEETNSTKSRERTVSQEYFEIRMHINTISNTSVLLRVNSITIETASLTTELVGAVCFSEEL